MSNFKTTVTAKAMDLVQQALNQFCQGKDPSCRNTSKTTLEGMAVGNDYATIPFEADDRPFTLECFANNDQASCHLSQRPKPFLAWLFGNTSGAGLWACSPHGSPLIDTKVVVACDTSADAGSYADASADLSSDAITADGVELPPDAISTEDAQDAGEDSLDVCQDACPFDSADVAEDVEDSFQDAAADLAGDVTEADGVELPPDVVSVDDAIDAEDSAPDAGADLSGDTTVADGVELPPDAMSTDSAVDAAADLSDDVTSVDVAFWGPVPSGKVFCTANSPMSNTILKDSGAVYFSPMCTYVNTIEVMSIIKDGNGKKQIVDKIVPLDVTEFNVNVADLADVALKSSTSIFVSFNALLPFGNTLPLDPAFTASGVELEFTLDPTFLLTWDPQWIAKDPEGHEVTAKFNPAVGTDPAYLSISYPKGVGLFANYTFPCSFKNAAAPIDYSKDPSDYTQCPQQAVKP